MTYARHRNFAFERGRPAPLLTVEPDASARLLLQRPHASNLAGDLSRWALARKRDRPLEVSWTALRRSPRLLGEPRIRHQ
jgi:hypothetical protein